MVHERGKFHVLCLARRIDPLDQFAQRKADPGNDDRPSLYTAMAVDPLFRRRHLDYLVDIEFLLLFDKTIDLHFPGASAEIFSGVGGIVFVGRELVVVVVVSHVFVRRDRLCGAKRTLLNTVDLVSRQHRHGRNDRFGKANAGDRCGSSHSSSRQKLPAVQIETLRSDLR